MVVVSRIDIARIEVQVARIVDVAEFVKVFFRRYSHPQEERAVITV